MVAALSVVVAVSHLWIAFRDWATRPHYLVGAVAGIVAAAASVYSPTPSGAALVVLIGISTALAIEGEMDTRLT